ncbi:MAG: HEAT repeat domain-containing protein [Phycisphaerae bacterium]|nr:HEAT repeat domain-containing protein [Phycisphaerae bacterium]
MSHFYTKTPTYCILAVSICFSAALFAEPNGIDGSLVGQLKINRWTLLNSTDEQIRIETAVELLKDRSPEARQILLDSLWSKDNAATQISVCRAISRFRSFPQLIPSRDDFLEPLINIIEVQPAENSRLAGQGLLIFTYRQVSGRLEKIIDNPDSVVSAKKGAIYALRIRPEKEAVSKLIDFLDSQDKVVAAAACEALQDWLPKGRDEQQWRKDIREFGGKSRTDMLREGLLTQQDKVRRLGEEVVKWQKRYIGSLDAIYQATGDDTARAKFIAENFTFDNSSIKLWAIEKINMWRKSGKSLPLDILQKPLITLISDSDANVRLAAARLLGMLTNVNSADAMLGRLKQETDVAVQAEILVSLGHVCNFALSPGSEVKINPQVRIETLDFAARFMKDSNSVVAAEAIRNLLLQNGLEELRVRPYFELIAAGYRKTGDEQMKGRFLDEMARLCGSDSFYRKLAAEVFGDIFKQAVDNGNDQIATPAVVGFIRVDPSDAFAVLKQKGFINHSSVKIRSELITVAGQIGTQDDLEWLGLILSNSDSEDERRQASEAMMNIFQHCDAGTQLLWAKRLAAAAKSKTDEIILAKSRALFESAEKKAEADQDLKLLFSIRRTMAHRYADSELYGQAARYYGLLLQSNPDPNEVPVITAKLLAVHLYSGQTESAKQIVSNILLSSDISPDTDVAKTLNDYFTTNQTAETAKQMFGVFASIKTPVGETRPLWSEQIEKWGNFFKTTPVSPVAEPNSAAAK